MRDVFTVDIRRHRGDCAFIVELVNRFCSGFSERTMEWLVRPDQAHLLPPASIIGEADQFDGTWAHRIRDRLAQHAQNGASGSTFWVLSYDNLVLIPAERLSLPNVQIKTKHLGELFNM